MGNEDYLPDLVDPEEQLCETLTDENFHLLDDVRKELIENNLVKWASLTNSQLYPGIHSNLHVIALIY